MENSDRELQVPYLRCRNTYTDTDTYSTYANTHTNSDTYAYTYPHTYANANAYPATGSHGLVTYGGRHHGRN